MYNFFVLSVQKLHIVAIPRLLFDATFPQTRAETSSEVLQLLRMQMVNSEHNKPPGNRSTLERSALPSDDPIQFFLPLQQARVSLAKQ